VEKGLARHENGFLGKTLGAKKRPGEKVIFGGERALVKESRKVYSEKRV